MTIQASGKYQVSFVGANLETNTTMSFGGGIIASGKCPFTLRTNAENTGPSDAVIKAFQDASWVNETDAKDTLIRAYKVVFGVEHEGVKFDHVLLNVCSTSEDAVATIETGHKSTRPKTRFAVEIKDANDKLVERAILEYADENAVKLGLKKLDAYAAYHGKHSKWEKIPKRFGGGISKDSADGETSVVVRKAQDGEKPRAKAKAQSKRTQAQSKRTQATPKAASNGPSRRQRQRNK